MGYETLDGSRVWMPNTHTNKCEWCSCEFKGRKKRFCSVDCRYQSTNRKRHPLTLEEDKQRRRKESRHIHGRRCEECNTFYVYYPGGTNIKNNNGGRFCSIKCYSESRKKQTAETNPKHSKVMFDHCVHCGDWYRKTNCNITCSVQCKTAYTSSQALEKNKKIRAELVSHRDCKECGETFIPEYGEKRRTFCSTKCGNKHAKRIHGSNHRHRARRFGVEYQPINPNKVLERDSYTCMICGIKTPKSLRGKQRNNSPEIDHRVPMSIGGGHTWDNVQCACRKCNREKSNTTSAGQMKLFNVYA